MTDRKQEAIVEEIIGGFFNAIRLEKDTFPRVASESTFRDIAINLYRRIAPLMKGDITWSVEAGEHRRKITIKDGEKEVYSLSCPTKCREFPEKRPLSLKEAGVDYIERDPQPKEACQKCGGSGTVYDIKLKPTRGPLLPALETEAYDCPSCDGTGECKHKKVGWIDPDCKVG